MQQQQSNPYQQYYDSRLEQLQKYMLAHKISIQENKLLQQRLQKQIQKLTILVQKSKWLQISIKDIFVKLDKIQQRYTRLSMLVSLERDKNTIKMTKIQQYIQQASKIYVKKEQIQPLIQQYNNTNYNATNVKNQQLQNRIIQINKQISYLRSNLTYQSQQQPKVQPLGLNIPTEILATKKDLRQSIQLIHQIYDQKINQMQKILEKLKNKSNKKIIKLVQTQVENKFDDYNLSHIRNFSKSDSVEHLKPLLVPEMKKKKKFNGNKGQKQTLLSFYRNTSQKSSINQYQRLSLSNTKLKKGKNKNTILSQLKSERTRKENKIKQKYLKSL